MPVWIVHSSDATMLQWRDRGSVNRLTIFDVASCCWEAHIWMNILAALVETRDKCIIIIIFIIIHPLAAKEIDGFNY